jgi:CDP-diacylglycerol--serine O-phosphatidyltransferase
MLVLAALMVSTIRFRSFKTLDLHAKRPYTTLVAFAASAALVISYPHEVLLIMAYGYLLSGLIGLVIAKVRQRDHEDPPDHARLA